MMQQLSVTQFQRELTRAMMGVMQNHEMLRIRHAPDTDIVMLRADEWERLQETLYVLENQSLMRQIAESLRTQDAGSGYRPSEDDK